MCSDFSGFNGKILTDKQLCVYNNLYKHKKRITTMNMQYAAKDKFHSGNVVEYSDDRTVLDDIQGRTSPNSEGYLTTEGRGAFVSPSSKMAITQDGQNNNALSRRTTNNEMDIYRGLGANVHLGMTVDEQLSEANLSWEVAKSPIRYGDGYSHYTSQKQVIEKLGLKPRRSRRLGAKILVV